MENVNHIINQRTTDRLGNILWNRTSDIFTNGLYDKLQAGFTVKIMYRLCHRFADILWDGIYNITNTNQWKT